MDSCDSLSNVLEIKVAVKSADECRKGNEHLGEWRVHVHEKLAFDVFRCKAAEVDLVEPTCQL